MPLLIQCTQIQEAMGPHLIKLPQNLSHFGSYLVVQVDGNHPLTKDTKKESFPEVRFHRVADFYLGGGLRMNLTTSLFGKPSSEYTWE